MKFSAFATEKKTGIKRKVFGIRVDKAGNITHIDLEPNIKGTCWEPLKNFILAYSVVDEKLEVHIGGRTSGI